MLLWKELKYWTNLLWGFIELLAHSKPKINTGLNIKFKNHFTPLCNSFPSFNPSAADFSRQHGLAWPFDFAVSKASGADFGGMLNAKNEQIMTNAVEYVVQESSSSSSSSSFGPQPAFAKAARDFRWKSMRGGEKRLEDLCPRHCAS